eukprot:scaffold858_cov123-Cylindrotheca_fusiformis.AAC.36
MSSNNNNNNDQEEQIWNICLQSRQGRKIVNVSNRSSTQDLLRIASDALQQDVLALKYGFPPKALPVEGQLKDWIQNQERLQVEFGTPSSVSVSKMSPSNSAGTTTRTTTGRRKKSTSNQTTTTTTTSSTIDSDSEIPNNGRKRSTRAASKAATAAMPSIIKAQEDMMKQTAAATSKKRPRMTTPTTTSRSRRTTTIPKFSASAGDGRRLADGAITANPARSSKARRNILQQGGDMSESLLGALNDKGKMGQVLRKGMKNAVSKSYETTKAFSRLAAVQAQSYQMEEVEEGSTTTDTNSSGRLIITYRGTVDKTKQTEEVDCIPRDILEAVIKGIYASNQEALRAENLALLSPRVLWSLLHAMPDHRPASVEDCYKTLLPDLDWSFLRRRAQQLSEKAMENARQEQEARGETLLDMDEAQNAIAAVEHAMEHLQEHERTERSSRQARAAMARLAQHLTPSEEEEWKLITPNEIDRDELRECIQNAPPPNADLIPSLITKLVKDCQIHNWRELANVVVNDETAIAEKIAGGNTIVVSPDQVSKWIDKAQELSVDEIIVDICDGNVDAVELLTEQARSGTPKDLANWRLIPEVLHGELQKDGATDGKILPTIAQLATWSKRAHTLLEQYEWLNWYATPIE